MIHVPVLLHETVDALSVKLGGVYVDGTLGRGGHAAEILRRAGEGATYVGIDRDETALKESRENLAAFAKMAQLHFIHANHGVLFEKASQVGVTAADGVLLDLGVSSPQLDDGSRGFSFREEGPLDMRMDVSQGMTAAEWLKGQTAEDMARVFREYGDERAAGVIAQAIVKAYAEGRGPETTTELAALIERRTGRHGAHHPATRVFQALRMIVNDEVGELERALAGGLALLKIGGRFAVITFESVTDRIVKKFFTAHAGREVSLQEGGVRWEGVLPAVRLVTRHAVMASSEEVKENVRSRSAKLRVVERIER